MNQVPKEKVEKQNVCMAVCNIDTLGMSNAFVEWALASAATEVSAKHFDDYIP
jgi:hypothetical protein